MQDTDPEILARYIGSDVWVIRDCYPGGRVTVRSDLPEYLEKANRYEIIHCPEEAR